MKKYRNIISIALLLFVLALTIAVLISLVDYLKDFSDSLQNCRETLEQYQNAANANELTEIISAAKERVSMFEEYVTRYSIYTALAVLAGASCVYVVAMEVLTLTKALKDKRTPSN